MPRPGVGIGLVGRVAERAALTAALDRARGGRATGVLLSGDAGVGKSRLVRELTAAGGPRVLTGRCLDTAGAELPYLPFSEIVGQLLGACPELGERHAGLLRLTPGGAPAERGARELGQLQVFEALLSALGEAAAAEPVVLVLEDLHWADRSSRDLLVFLLSRLTEQRLLVVATYRSDDLHRRHPLRPVLAELVRLPAVERLELGPLPPAQARELVGSLSGDLPLTGPELDVLARRSEGNAFFAEELVSAASGGRGGLPEALTDVLLTRVERLPEAARQVLRVASVAGGAVGDGMLAEVSGLDTAEFEAAVREALAHQVLVTDERGELVFRHALLREAVQGDLLPGERSRLHGRYAAVLAGRMGGVLAGASGGAASGGAAEPGTAAALAHHAWAAHDLPLALAASVQAAREADRVGAPAEVLRHAERALELWAAVPGAEQVAGADEISLSTWASWSASATGDPDRGLALGRRAVELADAAGDPERAADTRVRLALRLLEQPDGGGPAALASVDEAIALVGPERIGAEPAWAHAIAARALWRTDEVDAMHERGERALEIARESVRALRAGTLELPADPGGRDPAVVRAEALQDLAAVEADALITLAVGEEFAGRGPRSRELLTEALPLAQGSGNLGVVLRIFYNRGMSLLEEGATAAAADEFAAGGDRARETGTTWSGYGMDLRVAQLMSEFAAGRWDAAERTARLGGARVAPAVSGRLAAAELQVTVARGRLDEAERRWAELAATDSADDQVILLLGAAGTEAALWRGDPAEALRRSRAAVDRLAVVLPHHIATIMLAALGLTALADGGVAAGSTAADALLAAAEDAAREGIPRSGSLGVEGRAWLARARAEHARAAGRADREAWAGVVAAFGYGDPYRQAEAKVRLGEALLGSAAHEPDRRTAARLREAAATALTEARDAAADLGATPLEARAADLLTRSGAAATVRPGPSAIGLTTSTTATGGATSDSRAADTAYADRAVGSSASSRAAAASSGSGAPGRAGGATPTADPLTPREHAVLGLVAEGRTNRQVGEVLFISEKTVSVHLSRVMAKLGASSRTEAVAVGYERGLIPTAHQ